MKSIVVTSVVESCAIIMLVFLLVPLLLCSSAFAQSLAPEVEQVWKRFTGENGTKWQVIWDAGLVTPKSLRGALLKPFPDVLERVARRFVSENRDLFQVRADLSQVYRWSIASTARRGVIRPHSICDI